MPNKVKFIFIVCIICILACMLIGCPYRREAVMEVKEASIEIGETYTGYVCFLKKVSANEVDVYIKPNEDCILQAFDIYLDTSGEAFEIVSHTGKEIVTYRYNLQSVANGLEQQVDKDTEYKLATIILPLYKGKKYQVKIIRADLAIAFTPLPPVMDERYLQFTPITIGE